MESDSIYTDDEARERAIRYSRLREWLVLVGTAWSAAVNIVLLVSGLSARIRTFAEDVSPRRLGPVPLYTAITTVLSTVVTLPLAFYSGYVIEHRYNLSNQSRRGWAIDEIKGLGVSLGLGPLLAGGIFWVIRRYPRRWWAILSALTVPFSILVVNLAPVLLAPLFNKFEPLKDRAMARRIQDLAAGQGVTVSDVLQMDMSRQTNKVNAFFTGLGNTKRIVLGDTLLQQLTPEEVEVVLAHELGHQVHRDLWKLIGLQAPLSLITLFAVQRLTAPALRVAQRWGVRAEEGAADVAATPVLTLLAGGTFLFLMPLVNAMVRRGVEHPADQYALDLTHNPDAFVSSMQKLGRINLSDPNPPALVKWLLYNHPTLEERIAFGRAWKRTD